MYSGTKVYSKRDIETQPIKSGNIQEIGESEQSEMADAANATTETQKGL